LILLLQLNKTKHHERGINMEFMNYTIEIAIDSAWNVSHLSKDWRKKHWVCKITDGSKSVMWDCYGGSMADIDEIEALYYLLSDAETFIDIHTLDDIADEFGYTDYKEIKSVYEALRDAYNKAVQFFGTEDAFVEVLNKVRERIDE
jgi:hypothetical protein